MGFGTCTVSHKIRPMHSNLCICFLCVNVTFLKPKKTHFNCEIRGFDTVQNNFMDLPTHILAL